MMTHAPEPPTISALALCLLFACAPSSSSTSTTDAEPTIEDSGSPDAIASTPDSGAIDAAPILFDAAAPDAGAPDAEMPDAGPICSPPLPPPIDRIRVVIHNDMGDRKILDSTPIIANRDYCNAAGFGDRLMCPPRPEGHPETEACNAAAVGYAEDTGRAGPTWRYNDQPCASERQDGRCLNHSSNQFLVIVYGAGTARACSASGVCGEVVVP